MMNRTVLRLLGVLFWIAIGVGAYATTKSPGGGNTDDAGDSLVQYFAGAAATVQAGDPTGRLRVHDPVFYQDADGKWSQIGYVSSRKGQSVRIAWHRRDFSPTQCRLVQYRNGGSLEEVVATMLPPEKRIQIQQRMAAAMNAHGDELSQAFVPLVEASLRRSLPVIEEEFRATVDRHREEIDHLGQRWNDEVVSQRLIPLARREIMPIVREHGEPTADKIGRELWDRASLWRFAWRAVYDRSPLPPRNLVEEEWKRFVDQEAVPVFEQHMDEIVESVQRIVADVAANQVVRRELTEVADGIASDPETRALVRQILKETLVENERLRKVWSEVWTSDEARQAIDLAGDRLEPVVRQIGDDLFGTEEEGIDPNFARVLRNQILGKDRRWIVAARDAGSGQSATIEVADQTMPYPIVHLADAAQGWEHR